MAGRFYSAVKIIRSARDIMRFKLNGFSEDGSGSLRRRVFGMVARLNDSFGELGYAIVGLFALSWVVSITVYKWRGFDKIETTQQISVQS